MFKHFLLVTFRNIKRSKSTFLINLIGLSTGLACVLLIYLWINDELNFDKFHENDDHLYQVMVNHNNADQIVTKDGTPDLLPEALAEEMPEVKYATGVMPPNILGKLVLSIVNKKFKADGQFAGKDFFNVFSYKLIKGTPAQVLANKNSIVISQKLSLKLFNTTEDVLGKTLDWQYLNAKEPVVVSGIFEDTPVNSSAQFDFILSFEAWKDFSVKLGRAVSWYNFAPYTYLVLKDGSNIEQFNKKIAGFIKSKNEYSNVTLFARKYSSGYLYGKYENGFQSGGGIEYVKILFIIAIFIILIACINFMNLSTAKSASRLKEVGIKKAIGSDRKRLIIQFIGESVSITLLSLLLAVLLVLFLLPQFNEITGKKLTLTFEANSIFIFSTIAILTGIFAGSYPALYLSRLTPLKIFKRNTDNSSRELLIRKGLVVFQFTLSVILMISVVIVYNQVKFIQTKNAGYEKNNLIYIDKEGKGSEHPDNFLAEIKKIPGVVNASIIGGTMIGSQNSTSSLNWEGKNPQDNIFFEEVAVGYDMLETLGIEMKEGRTFSKSFGSENSKIIFNEAAIQVMGFKSPIGKTVRHYTGQKEIIGVVKNFHFESLHEMIKPLLFKIAPEFTNKFMIKIKEGKEKETITNLQEFYKKYNPGYSFDFKFLDEDYQSQYESEKRVELLSKYFAALAIIISCLGLFGLAAFTAEKRIKEIGIRKVLGADSKGIIFLLSKDFMKLISISLLIAYPIAWYITDKWLQDYAYKVDISLWMFVFAGGIALLTAFATVSFQAVKAATANPVESLKYE